MMCIKDVLEYLELGTWVRGGILATVMEKKEKKVKRKNKIKKKQRKKDGQKVLESYLTLA